MFSSGSIRPMQPGEARATWTASGKPRDTATEMILRRLHSRNMHRIDHHLTMKRNKPSLCALARAQLSTILTVAKPRRSALSMIMSALGENSDVELARRNFVSITSNRKRAALAVTVELREGRKQFCAFSARARFHTAWVKNRKYSTRVDVFRFTLRTNNTKHERHVVPTSELQVLFSCGLPVDPELVPEVSE